MALVLSLLPPQNLIMSESATMMVEFEHLSRVTGDSKYHNAVSLTSPPLFCNLPRPAFLLSTLVHVRCAYD
jgi:hypothetical protein